MRHSLIVFTTSIIIIFHHLKSGVRSSTKRSNGRYKDHLDEQLTTWRVESGPVRTTVPVASCPGIKGTVAITWVEVMIIIIKINIISTQTRLDNYYNSYNWVDVIIIIAQIIIIIIRVIVFILAVLILVTISDITIIVLVIEKCWKSWTLNIGLNISSIQISRPNSDQSITCAISFHV